MPQDEDVPKQEDVQLLGLLPSPDEIAAQMEVLTKRAATARRTQLECELEIAKLLAIMSDRHAYKSQRFVRFAQEHAKLSRTDAYDLLHLAGAADEIVTTHETATRNDPFHEWPTWRQALRDLHDDEDDPETEGGYWITPPDLYEKLDSEFSFDCDPLPHPRPHGHDALADDVDWGECSYVNASFRRDDEGGGRGLNAVGRKSIGQAKMGKTVVMVIPTHSVINLLLEAGAEARSLGRVKWLHTVTGRPWSSPVPCTAFILRGSPPD